VYLVTRPAATGTLSGTRLARDGVAYYERTFSGSQNRWGDYSAVEVDPATGDVWTINKTALAQASGCSSDCGRWGTFLTRFAASVLPVELVAFEATSQGQDALLTWRTAAETNNAGFRVEHRPPERATWREAAFVDGAGTTTRPQSYRTRVRGLTPGRHRFRLKQVDRDGTTTTAGTTALVVRPAGRYALEAPRPNPTAGTAALTLSVRTEQTVRATLYNTLGQAVRTLTRTTVGPRAPLTLRVDGTGLASGLYIVRVRGDTFTTTRKLTIAR
jgi:hypothetical protein